jgi:hypothetical protein
LAALLGATHCTGRIAQEGNAPGRVSGGDTASGVAAGWSSVADASGAPVGPASSPRDAGVVIAADAVGEPAPPPVVAITGSSGGAAADGGAPCNPYWWAPSTCSEGFACCRRVDAPPYVEGDAGIETPGYTCESPADARFVCRGPADGQPCDPNTASNDPLFCARGLDCCHDPNGGPFTCRVSQIGDVCVL